MNSTATVFKVKLSALSVAAWKSDAALQQSFKEKVAQFVGRGVKADDVIIVSVKEGSVIIEYIIPDV